MKPFEQATGCKVNAKYAGSSSEMVSLMANGGGGQYDLVSASGDADLRLIYGGDVEAGQHQPDPGVEGLPPVPAEPAVQHDRRQALRRLAPVRPERAALLHEDAFPTAPTSWSVIYDTKYTGKVTVPNNPIQIADAALYLSKTQPEPRHHRPLRADPAAVRRGRQPAQAAEAADQEVLGPRLRGDLAVPERRRTWSARPGRTRPSTLKAAGAQAATPSRRRAPPGGPTRGCSRPRRRTPTAPTSGCKWVSDAQGRRPSRPCPSARRRRTSWHARSWTRLRRARARRTTPTSPSAYFQTIKFWKTPLAQCGNGKNDCVPFQQWVSAWTQITG